MKKPKIFATTVNGTTTQVKAYKKENALRRLQMLDKSLTSKDVYQLKNAVNSHQAIVEEEYPEICNA